MPSAVTLIRSEKLSGVAEYAYAATAPTEARLIFLAGSCPLDADGATIDDVISTHVLVASSSQADLVEAREAVRGAFGDHDVPSALMGVTVLGYDSQLVEIEAVAAVVD
ncbi:RidA family protein [Nesterenkonia suensis]